MYGFVREHERGVDQAVHVLGRDDVGADDLQTNIDLGRDDPALSWRREPTIDACDRPKPEDLAHDREIQWYLDAPFTENPLKPVLGTERSLVVDDDSAVLIVDVDAIDAAQKGQAAECDRFVPVAKRPLRVAGPEPRASSRVILEDPARPRERTLAT